MSHAASKRGALITAVLRAAPFYRKSLRTFFFSLCENVGRVFTVCNENLHQRLQESIASSAMWDSQDGAVKSDFEMLQKMLEFC